MLTELVIENVKAYGPRQVVPLAPITLILGSNSAGKSTLIQSIALLKQSLGQSGLGSDLRLRGNLVDLGSFEGFVHQHKIDQSVVIGLAVKDSPDGVFRLIFTFNQDSERSIIIDNLEGQSRGRDFRAFKGELRRTLEVPTSDLTDFFKSLSDGYTNNADFPIQPRRTLETYLNSPEGLRAKLFLRSRFPFAMTGLGENSNIVTIEENDEYSYAIDTFSHTSAEQLILNHYGFAWNASLRSWREALRKTRYIGPFRQLPERISLAADDRLRDTGLNGENVVNYLAQRPHLIPKVNVWFANLSIPYSIKVAPVQIIGRHHSQEDMKFLILTDEKSGVQVSMQDVGYGISQILPIIVESISSQGSTLLIEQPELHLHPALQARLGDLFAEQSRINQFIIETHSEHLVLRIKRLIRRGELDAKDVALLSVNSNPDGTSSVSQIRLDSDGEFIDEWPQGFFDERLDEIFGD